MTLDQLISIMVTGQVRCALFYPFLIEGMATNDITTVARQVCFLATIGHESGSLRYTSEIWGPTPAQEGYEGRADLGNTQPGDGSRFRGRGLIQITGRDNYQQVSDALGYDYLADPERLGRPRDASLSAAWWFKAHGCNALADTKGFVAVTRRVNGGLNGWASRQLYYARAVNELGKPDFSNVESGVDTTAPQQ